MSMFDADAFCDRFIKASPLRFRGSEGERLARLLRHRFKEKRKAIYFALPHSSDEEREKVMEAVWERILPAEVDDWMAVMALIEIGQLKGLGIRKAPEMANRSIGERRWKLETDLPRTPK